ncbi:MAG: site-specific DNA-methyltransferase [Candidatus Omnitrophica bacterium]|nr:site-specific DNA-methyltransferase [Candidatus Omnitrophota bacterium]
MEVDYKNIKVQAKIIIGDCRSMEEIDNGSIDLIITSPPYWHIKDYKIPGQIGYGQTLHEYLIDLYRVWKECFRVLREGSRLCINIGDQFARAVIYGKYKIIPLHAEIITQCEDIGFDYMGSIIWQKKTTMNTTGGANIMGSFPYPPNGIIEIDYEFIHIFKKPGKVKKVPKIVKELSKLTKEEWKEFFSGHWRFPGAKQIEHEAMFPEELPRRLIKMFSYVGDMVLDPFLGSGTTVKVALELKRNAIGYEINRNFLKIIKEKLGVKENLFEVPSTIEIIEKDKKKISLSSVSYTPKIKDAKPQIDPRIFNFKKDRLYKIVEIIDEETIKTNTGLCVKFLGIKVDKKKETFEYLQNYILGKKVFLKFYKNKFEDDLIKAYVYLKNKIFINAYLIKCGLAKPDFLINHKYREKFIKLWEENHNGEGVDIKHCYKQMGVK